MNKSWYDLLIRVINKCRISFVDNIDENKEENNENDNINKWFDNAKLDTLAKTEHARWNMEQLLIGFRPLTAIEQAEVLNDLKLKNPYKGKLAHYDICSFARLKEIDEGSIRYDRGLSSILPDIYLKLSEQTNASKS